MTGSFPSSANNQFGASLPSRPNDQGQGNYLRERVIRHLRHEHRLYNFVLCFLMHLCSDLWRIKFSVCGGCNLPFPVVKRAWQLGVCLAFYVIRLFGQLALGLIAPRLRLLLPLQPCNRKDLPYFLFYYFFFTSNLKEDLFPRAGTNKTLVIMGFVLGETQPLILWCIGGVPEHGFFLLSFFFSFAFILNF